MTATAVAQTDTTPTQTRTPALADLEVTATSEEWLRKLRAVGVAASNHPPIPILACVLVVCRQGKVTFSAYDYETSAVAKLQHEPAGRLKDAQALLPLSWLSRTIRTITRRNPKAMVTLAAREMLGQRLLTVSAEGYTIPILNHYNVAEYPALPTHAAFESFGWQSRRLGRMHSNFSGLMERELCNAETARAVRDLYLLLWDKPRLPANRYEAAAISRTINRAAAEGWEQLPPPHLSSSEAPVNPDKSIDHFLRERMKRQTRKRA